jgi:drug/metabolite transporter (DMT)-like permease
MRLSDNLTGILLMTAAMAGFALSDLFLKLAQAALPIGQVFLAYGAGGTLCLILIARARRHPVWTRQALLPPVILRNMAEMVGTVCFITALAKVPLSTASLVLQAAPLVYLAAVALVLRMTVTPLQWVAVGIGFVGVLMIVRPGGAGFDPNILWPLAAVAALTLRDIATRAVPRDVPSLNLSIWGFATLIPVGLVWTALGGTVAPTPREQALLAGSIILGVAAYSAITVALRTGAPGVVTPFRYTRMLFGLTLGVAVLGERPAAAALVGAALIVASGVVAIRAAR